VCKRPTGDQEENTGRSKLWKAVLCSSRGEDGSCYSETTNDRTTMPRLLGSSPIKDGFSNSLTIKDGAKNKIVCFGEKITGTKVTNPTAVVGSSHRE
jgi:hypothetical protein